MKNIVRSLTLTALLSAQATTSPAFANDCHVGFKIGNGIFSQQLRRSTERQLNLKDYAQDQFDLKQLNFTAERQYDKYGRFEKCDLKGVSYNDERFSRFATAAKKGLVGAGLFTAGIATLYLTVLALTEPANKSMPENKSLSNNKDLIIITSYDHLDPFYYGPIVDRRVYRTHHVHYHHYYMSAYEYHRLRTAELGAIAATLLIVEAFEVPRNMRSTNFHGPAEDAISEQDCDSNTIKEKLVFDQYLYCGDFDGNAAQKFQQKENGMRAAVSEAFGAIKRGKFSKARRHMTHALKVQMGSDSSLAQVQGEIIRHGNTGIDGVQVLDGRSPHERFQRLSMKAYGRDVEVVCEQEWAYQRNDLFAVGADFIPLNSYKNCEIDKL